MAAGTRCRQGHPIPATPYAPVTRARTVELHADVVSGAGVLQEDAGRGGGLEVEGDVEAVVGLEGGEEQGCAPVEGDGVPGVACGEQERVRGGHGPNVGMDPVQGWTQHRGGTPRGHGPSVDTGPSVGMEPAWVWTQCRMDPTWVWDPTWAWIQLGNEPNVDTEPNVGMDPTWVWTQCGYGPNVGIDPTWRQDPTWTQDPTQLWPLTVPIAPQRPQQELRFGAGAVGVSHHHLRDGQVVHKGQQPLVRPPADGTCVRGAAPHHPPDPPRARARSPQPSPQRVVGVAVAEVLGVGAVLVQPAGAALDARP